MRLEVLYLGVLCGAIALSSNSHAAGGVVSIGRGKQEVILVQCGGEVDTVQVVIPLAHGRETEKLQVQPNNFVVKNVVGGRDPCTPDTIRLSAPSSLQGLTDDLLANSGAHAAWADGGMLFIVVAGSSSLNLYAADSSHIRTRPLVLAERPFAQHLSHTRWQHCDGSAGDLVAFGAAGCVTQESASTPSRAAVRLWRLDGCVNPPAVWRIWKPVEPAQPWHIDVGSARFPGAALTRTQLVAAAVLSTQARETASGVVQAMPVVPLPQDPLLSLTDVEKPSCLP